MDRLIEQIQSEIQAETKNQTEVQTTIQTESQTIPQTEVETASTAQKKRKEGKTPLSKQVSKNAQTIEKQIPNNVSDTIETVTEKELGEGEEIEEIEEELDPLLEYEEDEDDEEEQDEIEEEYEGIETGNDPLLDMLEEAPGTTVEEQFEQGLGDSSKSLDTLVVLGEMVMDFLDNSKAQLCSAISGQEPALYASDKKAKKALIEATKNYVQEIGVKQPSPTQTFLIAVGMWIIPSLSLAGFQRFQLSREAKKNTPGKNSPKVKEAAPQADSQTAPPETDIPEPIEEQSLDVPAVVDYTSTKEYQSKRRLFDRHAKGTYRHLSNGTYANVDLATEFPSAELLALLEEGHNNAEIRVILYEE